MSPYSGNNHGISFNIRDKPAISNGAFNNIIGKTGSFKRQITLF
jgi:hypothetical protein